MAFVILHDRIAITAEPAPEATTQSGLYVTGSAENPIHFGKVTHVGLGRRSEFNNEPLGIDLKVGDRVFYPKAAGRNFTVDGVDYLLLTNEEVVGVEVND